MILCLKGKQIVVSANTSWYLVAKRYNPAVSSLPGHIDGATTQRMLLKRRSKEKNVEHLVFATSFFS